MVMRAVLQALLFFLLQTAAASAPRKLYVAGSGLDMLSQPETVDEILELSGKGDAEVLYLGTATYDSEEARNTQTQGFLERNCTVTPLKVATHSPSVEDMRPLFEKANIVLVSGGNTLFARDRWMTLGIQDLLKEALMNGTVLCGGSAGGIIWFDGGHSDSMEPSSYKNPPGPFLNPTMTPKEMDSWAYIRVPGIGILPGLACPHYDVTGSNGVLRSADFTDLLRRHSGEYAVGIDNWAAVIIDGDQFSVVSRKGKPGSVDENENFTANHTLGHPGVWKLEVNTNTGDLQRTLVPNKGMFNELLRPARFVVQSNMLEVARSQNPDDGIPPSLQAYELPYWVQQKRKRFRFGN